MTCPAHHSGRHYFMFLGKHAGTRCIDCNAPASAAPIVERLRRTRISAPDIHGSRRQVPLNPDGPEAADTIERLYAALAAATGTAKTAKPIECEASQSGTPKEGNAQMTVLPPKSIAG
jgi:hypothetical protein